VIFPKGFLSLQLEFAKKASDLVSVPLDKALFEYTSLPVRFGVSFSALTEDNPIWQEFLAKLNTNNDLLETVYGYHLEKMKDASPMRYQFGCFSYDAIEDEGGIRLHFANNDSPEPGVLSDQRIDQRKSELSQMFQDVKLKHPAFTFVISSSWLFNVESFKRLFPESFTKNMITKNNDYRSLGIWGQFIDKYGEIKDELARQFIEAIHAATSFKELEECFPLKELKAEANITDFYSFYNVA
jgi:hypothetical protein